MTRSHLLILIGILTLLAPFSGLPVSWLEFALPVLGAIVAAIGYSYRSASASSDASAVSAESAWSA